MIDIETLALILGRVVFFFFFLAWTWTATTAEPTIYASIILGIIGDEFQSILGIVLECVL